MSRALVLLSAVVLLLMACASEQKVDDLSFESATLFGMIYDVDNQPCAGVSVNIDDGPACVTDIRGRFVVQNLKRGEHSITATKVRYEDLSVRIAFLNESDILHLQMTSFSQLLALAEKALGEQRWRDTETFLTRAEKLDPQDAVLSYLSAIHAYKTGAFETAVQRLTDIIDKGHAEPAVYLFLADIYEKNLNDHPKAIASLEAYLKLRADPDVESRLQELKGKE
jgi:tetratricopeptide (TPR) repeat protein